MRRFLRWTACILCFPAACLIALIMLSSDVGHFYDSINPTAFNTTEWREGDIRARGRMVRDLVDRKFLIGKSRGEVVAYLGPPDSERENLLIYVVDIGVRFGSSPWTYALRISLDPETGLVSAYFYTD